MERQRENDPRAPVPADGRQSGSVYKYLTLGGAALGGAGYLFSDSPEDTSREAAEEPKREPAMTVEVMAETGSERFDTVVERLEAINQLSFDEVQFVSPEGVLVGGPVPLRTYTVERTRINEEGEPELFPYALGPGPVDENGVPSMGIAKEWLEHEREQFAAAHPGLVADPDSLPAAHHITLYLRMKEQTNDPELATALTTGAIESYPELIAYTSGREVSDGSGRSRLDYLREEVAFDPELPPVVANELRRLLPGLVAHESSYYDHARSSADARGPLQMLPTTEAYYRDETAAYDPASFEAQVAAVGPFFSDLYRQLTHKLGSEAWKKLQVPFIRYEAGGVDEEAFQRELVVPLLLSAYNAGAARVAEALSHYLQTIDDPLDLPAGKDLFLQFGAAAAADTGGRAAGYQHEAAAYVPEVYAKSRLFSSPAEEGPAPDPAVQVATGDEAK